MNSLQPVIRFHFLLIFTLAERRKLKAAVMALFAKEKKRLQTIDYIFCSDNYLLKINRDYLQHETLTDIITFDLSEAKNGIVGEVYISVERVKENAALFNIPFQTEMRRVMFHGALHLCGYKDKGSKSKKLMTLKEDYYLDHF